MGNIEKLNIKSKHMNKSKKLCFKSLQRTIRPFCTTNMLSEELISIRLKKSKFGLKLIKENNYVKVTNNNTKYYFNFYCETNHELILKLLKHNLLV
jgi:hypothetical protein